MRQIDGFMYDSLPSSIKSFIHVREKDWQEWSDEQVVSWLYTELGKRYAMDPNYKYALPMIKFQVESEANEFANLFFRITKRNVTCIDLAKILQLLINDVFLIDCKAVLDGSGPHQYNIVDLAGKRIKLDLQEDLHNIQSGRRLQHFGTEDYYDGKSFSTFPSLEVDELLTSINYSGIPYTNDSLDAYLGQLKKGNLPVDKKIEIILLAVNLGYRDCLFKMGYCERTELFKDCILDAIYSGKNRKGAFREESIISHRTIKKQFTFVSCFTVRCEDGLQKHYINDGEKLKYEEVDEETFDKLLNSTLDDPSLWCFIFKNTCLFVKSIV